MGVPRLAGLGRGGKGIESVAAPTAPGPPLRRGNDLLQFQVPDPCGT